MGEVVDLDVDETYSWLPQTTKELDNKMFEEIGKALVYVGYFHPDWDDKQRWRIHKLVEAFATERRNNYGDIKWLREQLFMFIDETENMC